MRSQRRFRWVPLLAACLLMAAIGPLAPVRAGVGEPAADENPCDDLVPMRDHHGEIVIPPEAQNVYVGPVTRPAVPVSTLYPEGVDTSVDEFYATDPCDHSIEGELPPEATPPDLDAMLKDAGLDFTAEEFAEEIEKNGPEIQSQAEQRPETELPPVACSTSPPTGDLPGIAQRGRIAMLPSASSAALRGVRSETEPVRNQLLGLCHRHGTLPGGPDSSKPLGGRDVIFVHGFEMGPIFSKLVFSGCGMHTWPQEAWHFTNDSGCWKQRANAYWKDHIESYTKPAGNRYLVTAWASTQPLKVATHAVLTQIASAMQNGAGVKVPNPDDPRGTQNFCHPDCIVISHSTGGPVTDVSMSLAQDTFTDPALRNKLGDISWIPDHIKSHVALHGAFGGSGLATAATLLGMGLSTIGGPTCQLVVLAVDKLFGFNPPLQPTTICVQNTIVESVLVDLVPQVMWSIWGNRIGSTPVPVLVVAGGHPSSMGGIPRLFSVPLKLLLHVGYDDGVLTMNSQCANPNNPIFEPAGYVPADPTTVKRYDMTMNAVRGGYFWVEQNADRAFSATTITPKDPVYYAAAGCTAWTSPAGMIQPVAFANKGTVYDPAARYSNHHSFIQTTSDHSFGPLGPFGYPNYENTMSNENDQPNNREEVRTILDRVVYDQGLVRSSMGNLVEREVSGYAIEFDIPWWSWSSGFTWKRITWWIWKRTHDRLAGWQTMNTLDYVYAHVF